MQWCAASGYFTSTYEAFRSPIRSTSFLAISSLWFLFGMFSLVKLAVLNRDFNKGVL